MQKKLQKQEEKVMWLLLLWALVVPSLTLANPQDLCNVPGCSCEPSALRDDLIDVNCQCQSDQVLSLGPADGSSSRPVSSAPDATVQLHIEGCQQLEVFSRTLNSMPGLRNVTFNDISSLILHQRLYEARSGNGQSSTVTNFEISNVRDLTVKRHTFEGVNVDGTFMVKSVVVQRVPSLAFSFDSVQEFSIMSSRFDRVSMWGFKLDNCVEFNVLGNSRFFSLASQAFHMTCSKFMLAYNFFDNLQDSSLGVRYGLADIQGNTFEKLTGKPFQDLRPIPQEDLEAEMGPSQSGLVFRENNFACEPTLPFNALAMPAFDLVHNKPNVYLDIEGNNFVCDCNKIAWVLGAMTYNFDKDVIANGRGSLEFLQMLYDSAGQCLQCGLRKCEPTGTMFSDYAKDALMVHKGQLKCSATGQPLKSQKPGRDGGEFTTKIGDEEGLADIKNMQLSEGAVLRTSYGVVPTLIAANIFWKYYYC